MKIILYMFVFVKNVTTYMWVFWQKTSRINSRITQK